MAFRLGAVFLLAAAIVAAALWLIDGRNADGRSRIAIAGAWSRPVADVRAAAAVYLRIDNSGDGGDRLTGVETPAAAKADVHVSQMEGDIMRMRPVDSVEIAGGDTVALAPGGMHIMLTGLKQGLKEGESFPITLIFAKAGRIETNVAVREQGPAAGAMPAMPGMHDMPGRQP